MAKVHSSLTTTELHNPKGMGVESATEIILTMSASLGAVSASASIVPHTADTYNLGSADQRWNNITAAGNVSSSALSTGSFGRLELAGNATIDGTITVAGGTTTIGDSASDTLVITADLASNLIPDADGTRDIGSSAASWRNIHLDGTGSFKNTIIENREYFSDAGGEYISGDGTDLTITSGRDLNLTAATDINIPADVGLTFGNDAEKIEGDGTDLTIAGNNINLTAVADVKVPVNVGVMFGTHEKIESDDTDLNISVGANGDINIPTDIGLTFGDDGEKIEGDGTDLTIASSAKLNLTATSDVHIPQNVGLVFDANGSEKIESNDTDLTINAGADINLTAVGDVNIPSGVGVTFGNDGEKIEGDGTDLTISGNIINLSPTADVVLPNDKGIQFGGASEKIEGDGTDLTISANNLNIDAAADLVINVDGGDVTFHDDTAHLANISISKISGSATSTGSFAEGRIINKLGINESAPAEALEVGGNVSGSGTGSFHHGLIRQRSYLFDAGGEYFSGDGTDMTIASGQDINLTATTDINIPANVGLTFGNDGEKIEGDGTDLTIAGNNINLTGTADIKVPVNVGVMFGTHEKIESDDTDLNITVGANGDINIPADIGLTFGDDGEKIEGDGTDLTISGAKINLAAGSDVHIPKNKGIVFDDNGSEKIESNDTDLTLNSGADINLTATTDINIPSDVGLTFGDDGEKIEGDGTDMTIASSGVLTLSSGGNTVIETVTLNNGNVTIPGDLTVTGNRLEAQVGSLQVADHTITVGSGSATSALMHNGGIDWGVSGSVAFLRYRHAGTAISSSVFLEAPKLTVDTITLDAAEIDASGALTIDTGGDLTLDATGDVNVPANIGMTFGNDGEKIEGDGTDLTVASSAKLNLTATSDVHIPQNVGLVFDANASEKIESDDTDLTINSGAKINLTATSDVHIPNDVGIVFGGASEKIEGDGTDLTISANNLNVDAAADFVVNVDGGDITVHDDAAHIANINISKISGSATSTGSFGEGRIDHKLGIGTNTPGTEIEVIGSVSGSGTGSFQHSLTREYSYLFDAGGEYLTGDGTDMTIASGRDINLTATTDINIPADVGLTFGNDAEKIEGDGTDLTITGNKINLSPTADVHIPKNKGIVFDDNASEKIESNDTDLTINSGADINLTATTDINVPANVGITFGDDAEKIEGDGTDLTISANKIKIDSALVSGSSTSTGSFANVFVANRLSFNDHSGNSTGEYLESDGTDLNINVGGSGDINVPANIGMTFGNDGEKIEGDGTDLTIAGAKINLTAETDVHIPQNIGIVFDANGSEKIESNDTDLTINSGADINLTATADVNIPNGVGVVFGSDDEKIEGDGNDLTIGSGRVLTLDVTTDLNIDVDGGDVNITDDGAHIANINVNTISGSASSTGSFGSIITDGIITGSSVHASGDVVAFSSSDRELKDNLTVIQGSLDKIAGMHGYEFDWNDNSEYDGHDVGVVAQEVEAVFPEVVRTNASGYKAVRYEKLVPVLIQAVKELHEKVEHIEKNCECLNK